MSTPAPGGCSASGSAPAAATSLDDLVAIAERHLRAHWPAPDPEVGIVGRIVNALLYFIRDFTRAVGVTPAAYADLVRRYAAPISA